MASRGAALLLEDVAGIVLGLLPALDGVRFTLSVDPPQRTGRAQLPIQSPASAAVVAAMEAANPLQHPASRLASASAELLSDSNDATAAPAVPASTPNKGDVAADGAAAAGSGVKPLVEPRNASAAAITAAVSAGSESFLATFGGLLSRRQARAAAAAQNGGAAASGEQAAAAAYTAAQHGPSPARTHRSDRYHGAFISDVC